MAVSQSISLTQGTQNIKNNTTEVTFKWTSTQTGGSWNGYTRTAYYYVSINDGTEETYAVDYLLPQYTTQTIVNTTFTVKHKDDGTGKISVRTWMDTRISAGIIEDSESLELTTIPRESSLSLSTTNLNVGDNIQANITRNSDDFKHTVEFYINSSYYQKYTGVGTSQTFTIPTSWYNYMSSSTSCTAYCRITTYNGSTQIGEQDSKEFTVNVPSSIKPTIGTITLTPTAINGNSILVKGKNALTVSVSGCSAGTGSSITSYKFFGPSLSKTVSSTSTSASTSVSSVSSTGPLTYTVTITDDRGRTVSKTATITCYDYYNPTITSFNAYRANSDGTANINGAYLKCEYGANRASVNGTNRIQISLYYNGIQVGTDDSTTIIDLNGDIATTYQVYAYITDTYGGSNRSSTITVFGQARTLNITQDGTGIALGKMAESSNLFECRWDAKFNGNVECETMSSDTVNSTSIVTDALTVADKSISSLIQATLQSELATFKTTMLNSTYPVGSIYMSIKETSPATLFGGTWEQLKDRFLLAAGSYTAEQTGGEATHTLTVDEMPSHSHVLQYFNTDGHKNGEKTEVRISGGEGTAYTGATGGGKAHNNMPPYLVVYMWKRTE